MRAVGDQPTCIYELSLAGDGWQPSLGQRFDDLRSICLGKSVDANDHGMSSLFHGGIERGFQIAVRSDIENLHLKPHQPCG